MIDSHPVEIVDPFKYLGTYIDSKLNFVDNINYILKKCMQQLFLRRIVRFGVSQNTLEIAYKPLLESVLTYNLTSWYGHLNCKQKHNLARVTKTASTIIGRPQSNLGEVYTSRCVENSECILKDSTHPLCDQFVLLPSGRQQRYIFIKDNLYLLCDLWWFLSVYLICVCTWFRWWDQRHIWAMVDNKDVLYCIIDNMPQKPADRVSH